MEPLPYEAPVSYGSEHQVGRYRQQHQGFLDVGVSFHLIYDGKPGGVFHELCKFHGHPGHVHQEGQHRELVQVPHQEKVGDDVHPGDDQDEARSLFVAEQLGVGDIFRLVPGRTYLSGNLPDQRRKVQRPCGQEIHPCKQGQIVLEAGE